MGIFLGWIWANFCNMVNIFCADKEVIDSKSWYENTRITKIIFETYSLDSFVPGIVGQNESSTYIFRRKFTPKSYPTPFIGVNRKMENQFQIQVFRGLLHNLFCPKIQSYHTPYQE